MKKEEHPQTVIGRQIEEQIRKQQEEDEAARIAADLKSHEEDQEQPGDKMEDDTPPKDDDEGSDDGKKEAKVVSEKDKLKESEDEESEEDDGDDSEYYEEKQEDEEGVPKFKRKRRDLSSQEQKRRGKLFKKEKKYLVSLILDYEHRWNVYSGVLSSKDKAINELNNTIYSLQEMVKSVSKNPEKQSNKKESKETEVDVENLKEKYGEEWVEDMLSLAKAKGANIPENIEEDITKMRNTLAEIEKQRYIQSYEGFIGKLRSHILGFDDINKDPDFKLWLETWIPDENITWKQALNDAVSKMNIRSVSEIFSRWRSQNYEDIEEVKKAHKSVEKEAKLERHVTPSKAKSVPENTSVKEPRKYRRSDIENLYKRLAKGEFRGKEEEFDKEQKKLMDALAEGKIEG